MEKEVMSNGSSSSSSGGIGFVGLLTIVFITLKLLGKIDWSWWWVLSPIWISVILAIVFLVGCVAVGIGAAIISSWAEERNRKSLFGRPQRRLGARRTTGRVVDPERSKEDSFLH